jgi:hypothetical protein
LAGNHPRTHGSAVRSPALLPSEPRTGWPNELGGWSAAQQRASEAHVLLRTFRGYETDVLRRDGPARQELHQTRCLSLQAEQQTRRRVWGGAGA